MKIIEALPLFILYSLTGWIIEVIVCSIAQNKFVNRGFLYSPILPIYGCGGLLIGVALTPLYSYPYLVFILGVLITSALEYATSFIMEKLFHLRWWDYSKKKFNIKGRVCLRNSLCFGLLALLMIYLMQPTFLKLIRLLPSKALIPINAVLAIGLIIDIGFSTARALRLGGVSKKIMELKDKHFSLSEEEENFFFSVAKEVVKCEKYRELSDYTQHNDVTVYEHSLYVAYEAYRLARLIKLNCDECSLIRGALLHDFFLYDWHDKNKPIKLHAFRHSMRAYVNAKRYYDINKIEKDIIVKHMWPLTLSIPSYRESILVTISDKLCATSEILNKGRVTIDKIKATLQQDAE